MGGFYGIREKIDEHYVESNHGIDSKKVDLLNKDGALAGSEDHFLESYDLIMNSNTINTPVSLKCSGRDLTSITI